MYYIVIFFRAVPFCFPVSVSLYLIQALPNVGGCMERNVVELIYDDIGELGAPPGGSFVPRHQPLINNLPEF